MLHGYLGISHPGHPINTSNVRDVRIVPQNPYRPETVYVVRHGGFEKTSVHSLSPDIVGDCSSAKLSTLRFCSDKNDEISSESE